MGARKNNALARKQWSGNIKSVSPALSSTALTFISTCCAYPCKSSPACQGAKHRPRFVSVSMRRALHSARFVSLKKANMLVNRDMGPSEVHKFCQLDKEGLAMIRMVVKRMGLSARAYHRVLKLGRTIVNLAGSDSVQQAHLAEALQYRPRGAF